MAEVSPREGERLTARQLALESDVDEDQLERLVAAGVLRPQNGSFGWTDVWRVRTLRSLEEAGVPFEKMAPHFYSGRLSLDFLEDMLPPPAPQTGRTFGEFAESLGERGQMAGSVYEMLGLARPTDDMKTRTDEEEVVREILELWSDDPKVMKRAARLAGYAIRMIVEGWTGLHSLASLRQGGRVVKLLGDGALLLFSEAASAARATLEVFDDLTDQSLQPHAGIDCGPIVERDGDVFGRTVNMASRLASAASESQILVSAPVAQAAQAAGMTTHELGPLELKGVERTVLGFSVSVEGSGAD